MSKLAKEMSDLAKNLGDIASLQEEITKRKESIAEIRGEAYRKTITKEVIDAIAPVHCRTSCSDTDWCNAGSNHSGYIRCNRCALLSALQTDEWNEIKISVTVEDGNVL